MHPETQLIITGVACTPTIVAAIEQDGSKLAAMPDMKLATNGDWIPRKHLAEIVSSEVTRVDPVVVNRSGPDELSRDKIAQLETDLTLLNGIIVDLNRTADEASVTHRAEINEAYASSAQNSLAVYALKARGEEVEALKLEIDAANEKHASSIAEWHREVKSLKLSLEASVSEVRALTAALRDTQIALREAQHQVTNLQFKLPSATAPTADAKAGWMPVTIVEPSSPWTHIPSVAGTYIYWDGTERDDGTRIVHIDAYRCEEESGDHARAGFYQQVVYPKC